MMKHRSVVWAFSVAVIAGLGCARARAQEMAGDWPNWRGPAHNGISKESIGSAAWPKDGLKELWSVDVGTGFSSMSVAGGRVYTMGNTNEVDTIFCLDAASGKVVWKHSYPCSGKDKWYEGGTSSTPTVAGGKVYTLSKDGEAFCLDAKTGKVAWSTQVAKETGAKKPIWGFASSPYIEGDLVILNMGRSGTALNKATGKVVWKSGTDEAGYSSAVPMKVDGKDAVVFLCKNTVRGVETATGKVLWEHPWETAYDCNIADPVVDGNRVFVSAAYGHGCALLEIKGGKASVVWENKEMMNHFNSCVLWKGNLYGFHGNENTPDAALKCLDFNTGKVRWADKGEGLQVYSAGSLLLVDGKLTVFNVKGWLLVGDASADGFKPSRKAWLLGGKCWTVPVVSGGRVYARNAVGQLVCAALPEN